MRNMSIITTTMSTAIPAAVVTTMDMRNMSIITTTMSTAIPAAAATITVTSTAPMPAARSTSWRIWAARTALPRWKRKSMLCPA